MAKELRKITVRRKINQPMETRAFFHKWGNFPYEINEGLSFQCTKAIVELEDGTIMTLRPEDIKFKP